MHPNKNWVILFVPFEVFKHEYKLNLLRIQTKLGHPRATKKKKNPGDRWSGPGKREVNSAANRTVMG